MSDGVYIPYSELRLKRVRIQRGWSKAAGPIHPVTGQPAQQTPARRVYLLGDFLGRRFGASPNTPDLRRYAPGRKYSAPMTAPDNGIEFQSGGGITQVVPSDVYQAYRTENVLSKFEAATRR